MNLIDRIKYWNDKYYQAFYEFLLYKQKYNRNLPMILGSDYNAVKDNKVLRELLVINIFNEMYKDYEIVKHHQGRTYYIIPMDDLDETLGLTY